jgi:CRP/FNR family cyclic AMP-dependent transcriptional regulator
MTNWHPGHTVSASTVVNRRVRSMLTSATWRLSRHRHFRGIPGSGCEMQKTASNHRLALRAGRWFQGLPTELQERLLQRGSSLELAPNQQIFMRGQPPDGIYAMLDGAVSVSGTDSEGNEALLTVLVPPGWFGEISLFDRQPRTHDVISDGEGLLFHVPQRALDEILEAEPRYWRDFALLVTSKLRLMFIAMEDWALLPTATRLARRLVLMAEGYGEWQDRSAREVHVSQEKLVALLSTSRQTVNHILKELETAGLIRLSYGGVEILDLPALREAARSGDEVRAQRNPNPPAASAGGRPRESRSR